MVFHMNKKKMLAKVYIKGLEQYGFLTDLTLAPIPKLRKLNMKAMYKEANRVRMMIGEKPKKYFTIEKGRLVEVESK